MANKIGDEKPGRPLSEEGQLSQPVQFEFSTGMTVRCGGFVGMLSWIDQDIDPITKRKSGDCRFVYLCQVPRGQGSALHGFDGLYFAVKDFKTNVNQLKIV